MLELGSIKETICQMEEYLRTISLQKSYWKTEVNYDCALCEI